MERHLLRNPSGCGNVGAAPLVRVVMVILIQNASKSGLRRFGAFFFAVYCNYDKTYPIRF
jgi:hypothetical protein